MSLPSIIYGRWGILLFGIMWFIDMSMLCHASRRSFVIDYLPCQRIWSGAPTVKTLVTNVFYLLLVTFFFSFSWRFWCYQFCFLYFSLYMYSLIYGVFFCIALGLSFLVCIWRVGCGNSSSKVGRFSILMHIS